MSFVAWWMTVQVKGLSEWLKTSYRVPIYKCICNNSLSLPEIGPTMMRKKYTLFLLLQSLFFPSCYGLSSLSMWFRLYCVNIYLNKIFNCLTDGSQDTSLFGRSLYKTTSGLCTKSESSLNTVDWLIDWLIHRSREWVSEWMSDWVIEWLSDWVSDWLSDWWMDEWMDKWMDGWMDG